MQRYAFENRGSQLHGACPPGNIDEIDTFETTPGSFRMRTEVRFSVYVWVLAQVSLATPICGTMGLAAAPKRPIQSLILEAPAPKSPIQSLILDA